MRTIWSLTLSVSVVIQDDIVFRREDLMTCQEQVDVTIIQQMVKRAEHGTKRINIECKDGDVSVVFLHFYAKLNLTCRLGSADRNATYTGTAANEYAHEVSQMIAPMSSKPVTLLLSASE